MCLLVLVQQKLISVVFSYEGVRLFLYHTPVEFLYRPKPHWSSKAMGCVLLLFLSENLCSLQSFMQSLPNPMQG